MFPRLISIGLLGLALAARVPAAERALTVDRAHSRVEIAVTTTVDSFVATLGAFDARVALNDDGRPTAAHFAFRFGDVTTGKASRDKAMHRWQETGTHPDGGFDLTALEAAAGGALTAFGRLTLHGVTRELRFPVAVTRDGDRCAIDGEAPLDVREFGLPVIRMFGVLKVDPIVRVRFHLQGAAR